MVYVLASKRLFSEGLSHKNFEGFCIPFVMA